MRLSSRYPLYIKMDKQIRHEEALELQRHHIIYQQLLNFNTMQMCSWFKNTCKNSHPAANTTGWFENSLLYWCWKEEGKVLEFLIYSHSTKKKKFLLKIALFFFFFPKNFDLYCCLKIIKKNRNQLTLKSLCFSKTAMIGLLTSAISSYLSDFHRYSTHNSSCSTRTFCNSTNTNNSVTQQLVAFI